MIPPLTPTTIPESMDGKSPSTAGLGVWLPIEIAPKDNTLLLLLVEPDDHATEDAALCRTIGGNNLDNDGDDRWQFAGWCWSHDHFTEGTGKVIGWLPLPEAANVENSETVIRFTRRIRDELAKGAEPVGYFALSPADPDAGLRAIWEEVEGPEYGEPLYHRPNLPPEEQEELERLRGEVESLEMSNTLWQADNKRICTSIDSLPCILESTAQEFDTPEAVMHVVAAFKKLTQRHKRLLDIAMEAFKSYAISETYGAEAREALAKIKEI